MERTETEYGTIHICITKNAQSGLRGDGVSRMLRIGSGLAIAAMSGGLALAAPARADVLTLMCEATSVGGFGAQTYVVDLAARTIAARPGNLEGNGFGAISAGVGHATITWPLTSGSAIMIRRIDRHTGALSTWTDGRLTVSGWFCRPATN
jgi:hypothetical protein